MADPEKREDQAGIWSAFVKELSGPWDWVAAGFGATGGLIVSASTFHTDLGASVGVGALGAVTAKKAAVASMRGIVLRRRARALVAMASKWHQQHPLTHTLESLITDIERDIDLQRTGVLAASEFQKTLDKHVETFRKYTSHI